MSAESRGSPAKVVGTSSIEGGWSPTRSLAELHVERAGTVMTPGYAVAIPARQVAEASGGVAPVGHPEPLRTIVDIALSRYDVVWAAGGHPHYVFPTSYDELLRITAGEAAEIGAV